MGLRITNSGDSGQSPLDIVHGILVHQGEQYECDRLEKVSHVLGKKVENMTDLTVRELSVLAVELVKGGTNYGTNAD